MPIAPAELPDPPSIAGFERIDGRHSDYVWINIGQIKQYAKAYAAQALSQAAADAQRYRWWVERGYTVDAECKSIENELLPGGETFDSIDAAIDAAMANESIASSEKK